MPAKVIRYFRCPEHGMTTTPECVLCKAIKYKKAVKSGKIPAIPLRPGQGPCNGDPTKIEILLKAKHIKKENLKKKDREQLMAQEIDKQLSKEALRRILKKKKEV